MTLSLELEKIIKRLSTFADRDATFSLHWVGSSCRYQEIAPADIEVSTSSNDSIIDNILSSYYQTEL